MIPMRHKVIVTSTVGDEVEYDADFQATKAFFAIDAYIEAGFTVSLLKNGMVIERKKVVEVYKHHGPPDRMAHTEVVFELLNTQSHSNQINITGSTVNGLIAAGNNNTISEITFNIEHDIKKIIDLIDLKDDISDEDKTKLKEVITAELPNILNTQDKGGFEKLKNTFSSFKQTWLIPIVANLMSTYFGNQIGL